MAEEHGAQLEERERELRADAAGDVAAAPERKTLALDTCMGLAAQESEQPQRDALVKALQFCQVANAAALAELEAAVEARKQALKAEVAEARRSAKLEENELKRRLREEERLSRREDKRRRREEEAASRRDAALTSPASAARKESWAVAAARKGLPVGGRVEGPIDGEGSHDGSWFAGSVIDVPEKGRARVLFDRTPAAPSSAGADASKTTGVLLPLEALRPLPPPPPPSAELERQLRGAYGTALELRFEGGWWEVELLGGAGSAWAKGGAGGGEGRGEAGGEGGEGSGADAAAATEAEAVFTVRLRTAAAEGEGVYDVPTARLRPGWLWKGGRWAGRWRGVQERVPEPRTAQGDTTHAQMVAAWGARSTAGRGAATSAPLHTSRRE